MTVSKNFLIVFYQDSRSSDSDEKWLPANIIVVHLKLTLHFIFLRMRIGCEFVPLLVLVYFQRLQQ
jgi:hypothetical protein